MNEAPGTAEETDTYLRSNPDLRLDVSVAQITAIGEHSETYEVVEATAVNGHRILYIVDKDKKADRWYAKLLVSKDTGQVYLERTQALGKEAASYLSRLRMVATQIPHDTLRPLVKGKLVRSIDFNVANGWAHHGITGFALLEIRESTLKAGEYELWLSCETDRRYSLLDKAAPLLSRGMPIQYFPDIAAAAREAGKLQGILSRPPEKE